MLRSDDERLLTRDEVADRFGLSKRFLETAARRGDGPPFVRIGRLVRYEPGAVRAWIATRRVAMEER